MFIVGAIIFGTAAAGFAVTSGVFAVKAAIEASKARKEKEEEKRRAAKREIKDEVDNNVIDPELAETLSKAAPALERAAAYKSSGISGEEMESYALPEDTEAHKVTMANYDRHLDNFARAISDAEKELKNPERAAAAKATIQESTKNIDLLTNALDSRIALKHEAAQKDLEEAFSPLTIVLDDYDVDERGIITPETWRDPKLKEKLETSSRVCGEMAEYYRNLGQENAEAELSVEALDKIALESEEFENDVAARAREIANAKTKALEEIKQPTAKDFEKAYKEIRNEYADDYDNKGKATDMVLDTLDETVARLEETYGQYNKLDAIAVKGNDKLVPNSVGDFSLREEIMISLADAKAQNLVTDEIIKQELAELPKTQFVNVGEEAVKFEEPFYAALNKYRDLLKTGPRVVTGPTAEELAKQEEKKAAEAEVATTPAKNQTVAPEKKANPDGMTIKVLFQRYEIREDVNSGEKKLSLHDELLKQLFEKYPEQSPSMLKDCLDDYTVLKKIVNPVGEPFKKDVSKKEVQRMAQRFNAIEEYSKPGLAAGKTAEMVENKDVMYAEVLKTVKSTVDHGFLSIDFITPTSYKSATAMISGMPEDARIQMLEKFGPEKVELMDEAVVIYGFNKEVQDFLKAMGFTVVKEPLEKAR